MILTVTGDALSGYAIHATSFNISSSKIRIWRKDTSGHYADVFVRGVVGADITSTSMNFFDYEAPFNISSTTYYAEGYFPGTPDTILESTTSSPISTSIVSTFGIVMDPSQPTERVGGAVLDFATASRPGRNLGSHAVLGRKNPVIVKDVLGGRSGTISFSNLISVNVDIGFGAPTMYAPSLSMWRDIFESGNILYFRSDYTSSGFDDLYFSVDSVGITRVSGPVGSGPVPVMTYEVAFTEVDPPNLTVGHAVPSWADVLTNHSTWADVIATRSTWANLLTLP